MLRLFGLRSHLLFLQVVENKCTERRQSSKFAVSLHQILEQSCDSKNRRSVRSTADAWSRLHCPQVQVSVVHFHWTTAVETPCKPAHSWSICLSKRADSFVEELLRGCRLWLGLSRRWVQRPPPVLPWVSLWQTAAHAARWRQLQAQPRRWDVRRPAALCVGLVMWQWLWISFAGLLRVRQSLKTLEPIDELKKGAFTLQVRVLDYRQVNAGVEVDILLSATSRTGRPVWESVLTLLSRNKLHKGSRRLPMSENKKDHPSGNFSKHIVLLWQLWI